MGLPESDDALMLLHNPRCSKSRTALALLVARGLEFVERRYLEDSLSAGELEDLEGRLGLPLSAWVRTGARLLSGGTELAPADQASADSSVAR